MGLINLWNTGKWGKEKSDQELIEEALGDLTAQEVIEYCETQLPFKEACKEYNLSPERIEELNTEE